MRPTLPWLFAFSVWLSLSVFVTLMVVDRPSLENLSLVLWCGLAGAAVWSTALVLPSALRPSPGVAGFVASFAPAFFIFDAFFLGVGLLFIVVCSFAGVIFGLVSR